MSFSPAIASNSQPVANYTPRQHNSVVIPDYRTIDTYFRLLDEKIDSDRSKQCNPLKISILLMHHTVYEGIPFFQNKLLELRTKYPHKTIIFIEKYDDSKTIGVIKAQINLGFLIPTSILPFKKIFNSNEFEQLLKEQTSQISFN